MGPLQISYGGSKKCSLYSQLGCPEPLFENQSSSIIILILLFCSLLHCWFYQGNEMGTQIQVKVRIYSRSVSSKILILLGLGIALATLWRKTFYFLPYQCLTLSGLKSPR